MNKFIALILIISLTTLLNCGDTAEEPGIDCSGSDLSVEVISFVKSDCDLPGSITLEASGGEGDYRYSLDGESFQSSEVFNNLFAGVFTLSVKDELGCSFSKNFTLESEPTGITLNLSGNESNCTSNTGSILAEASGGVGILQFSLDDGEFSNTSQYTGISPGNHTVIVKDEEECSVSKTIQIATNTSLSDDVMPIVRKDCAISGCHNGSQSPRLSTNSEVIQNARRIKSEIQSRSMPRDRTLTQAEIDLITCWVDDGAEDN